MTIRICPRCHEKFDSAAKPPCRCKCAQCGKRFTQSPTRPREYCSDRCRSAAYRKRLAARSTGVRNNSGAYEWYTPPEITKAAASVMGGIDLDPASSAVANEMVGAARFYSEAEDGLALAWHGRVWLNPPYSQPLISRFCERLIAEFGSGRVSQACALVNNGTETAWFGQLAAAASAVCFPSGRIRFWRPGSEKSAPLQGQAVLYLGPHADRFQAEFARFGWIALLGQEAA